MRKIDLLRYINGELDDNKSRQVKEWIESSNSNRRYFNCLKESYTLMTLPEERATEEDFADFLSKYNLDGNKQKTCSKNIFRYAAAISAAAAVVLFVALGFYNKSKARINYTNIIANNTSDLLLDTLPDGSIIGLSPNSEVRYSNGFNTSDRSLLLYGTCYFDIAKNRELPFKVMPNRCLNELSSQKVTIEVTGTKFYTTTVSSELMEIALKEGSVNVKMHSCKCIAGLQKNIVSMKEGDYLQVSHDLTSTKTTIKEHGNPMMDAMTCFLNFKNAKLSEIIKKISVVHRCKFSIMNPCIANHLLTADLADNTLEDILAIFEVTMGVSSSINGNGIIELR